MRISMRHPSTIPRVFPLLWLKFSASKTHIKILLLYAVTMLLGIAAAVPIFRFLLFAEVDKRVRHDLQEELETFQAEYAASTIVSPTTDEALTTFIDAFWSEALPEDDNFHIILLDGELYQSNPRALPSALQPGSEAMQQLLTLREPTGEMMLFADPEAGNIIYQTSVLETNNSFRGQFVVAHLAAGEQAEMLAAVEIFAKVTFAVVGVAFFIAWLGSRQLLKPIEHLTATAQNIDENSLSQRLTVQGSGELATLAESFNTMMDRVQNAFGTQQNFINEVGHELRNPITIIQGHLELMGTNPVEQQETLDLVMDELNRMGRFVHDLIFLAKAERPDFLQLETIDLEAFMAELFSKVKALADRNWKLSSTVRCRFVADRQRITAALINLAQNAVQHSQFTDTIELGSTIVEGKLRFWVQDSGEGIEPDEQQRIFDRFARGTNSHRHPEGVGLGLAIVKAIADAHGGYVELISQLGKGSTFSVVLPME